MHISFYEGLNNKLNVLKYKQRLGSLVVEQGTHNPKVTGSIPVRAKEYFFKTRVNNARVAEWLLHWIHNPWLRQKYPGSNPGSCIVKQYELKEIVNVFYSILKKLLIH